MNIYIYSLLNLSLLTQFWSFATSISLHVLTALVSSEEGAGMDGGALSILNLGGGAFTLNLINDKESCSTGVLNSLDDNWERGELNFFVGSQLKNCQNFDISNQEISFILRHQGRDGGKLEYFLLGSSAIDNSHKCEIGVKLDGDQEFEGICYRLASNISVEESSLKCNGHKLFCELPVNRFTFAGSHNAGTGNSDRWPACLLRNQDLNIAEQLQFGIRFLDLDIIFREGSGSCHGLETGHGKRPELGLYRCFGLLDEIFKFVANWLSQNEREVIVLFFGEVRNEDEAVPELRRVLNKHFKLNTSFKRSGKWPTLGEAIASDERVFVFADSELIDDQIDLGIVKINKISINNDNSNHDKEDFSSANRSQKAVRVISTFKSGSVGTDCSDVISTSWNVCQLASSNDFVKLALFTTFSLRRPLCLWDQARICNGSTREILQTCKNALKSEENNDVIINFAHADYSNYPANGQNFLIKDVFQLNLERAKKLLIE